MAGLGRWGGGINQALAERLVEFLKITRAGAYRITRQGMIWQGSKDNDITTGSGRKKVPRKKPSMRIALKAAVTAGTISDKARLTVRLWQPGNVGLMKSAFGTVFNVARSVVSGE